jgi:anti-sigma regulatory factor (Ser/Thr protein kinase)
MTEKKPCTVTIKFPGDLEYIPAVRKFVSELLQVNRFDSKSTFRSEIIIDEICNNAVNYGCRSADPRVEVTCMLYADRIEFLVKDSGGSPENLNRLRSAGMADERGVTQILKGQKPPNGLGLEIVRLLSEKVELDVDDNNMISVRVVRLREDTEKAGIKKPA